MANDPTWGYAGERVNKKVVLNRRDAMTFNVPRSMCDDRTIIFNYPPVRTEQDMTTAERRAIERQYGVRFAR